MIKVMNKVLKQEDLQGMVIMALTQYDMFDDFKDRCKEFGIEPFMNLIEYVDFFNDFWACPKGYHTAYEACIDWHIK